MTEPMPRPTLTWMQVKGNLLFERAVTALGLDRSLMSRVVEEVLRGSGSAPSRATPDDLGFVLPEIERKLLLIAPYERAAPGLARLRRLIITWDIRS
jgi:hypothetical protein